MDARTKSGMTDLERKTDHSAFLFGCPKLDAVDYSEKLTEIIRDNDIKSVTIVRMEVPCCGAFRGQPKMLLKTVGNLFPGRS